MKLWFQFKFLFIWNCCWFWCRFELNLLLNEQIGSHYCVRCVLIRFICSLIVFSLLQCCKLVLVCCSCFALVFGVSYCSQFERFVILFRIWKIFKGFTALWWRLAVKSLIQYIRLDILLYSTTSWLDPYCIDNGRLTSTHIKMVNNNTIH